MQLTVRSAEDEDVPRLNQIARDAKAHWGYPPGWLQLWAKDLTLSAEYLQAHRSFVACDGGAPVGMCVLEDHGDRWTIEHFWIDPVQHRKGIGRWLLQHALEAARGTRPGRVEVRADPFAEPFYLRFGARRLGEVAAPMPGAPQRRLPLLEFTV
jgi:predicted N-acetyltransferase YhbS